MGAAAPLQEAVVTALKFDDSYYDEVLDLYTAKRDLFCQGLDSIGLEHNVCLLYTSLVCDAINVAMREIFLQIVYGRSQTAFSEGGLPVGASLDDLGKGLRSQVGTCLLYTSRCV